MISGSGSARSRDHSRPEGSQCRLDSITHAEFHEDPGDVGLHRRLAEVQLEEMSALVEPVAKMRSTSRSRGLSTSIDAVIGAGGNIDV